VKKWLLFKKKKTLVDFFTKNKKAYLSQNWKIIVKMESLFQNSLRKTLFGSLNTRAIHASKSGLVSMNAHLKMKNMKFNR
jgi:hypothetical protein